MRLQILGAIAAIALGSTAAIAAPQHGPAPHRPVPHKVAPKPHTAKFTPHQRRCMARYKSYDPRTDTHVVNGRRVRCRL